MTRQCLSSALEIIDEARNGRMFILVDDEQRENEGDLVIPAQMATPEAINFMARFGRGLICLALTTEQVKILGLSPMSRENRMRHSTAFMVSIEARDGISTGISAADRARTISVAIRASTTADEIISPGHVFPLEARPGGVLVRAGHTEAAVDVARLAGLNPAGVICEIMNDDGTMARLDDLWSFAAKHDLKIGTIRDLIAHRRRHDHLVEKVETTHLTSNYGGDWRVMVYKNKVDGTEAVVLQKGEVERNEPMLVRMHSTSLYHDMLGMPGDRERLLQRSMEEIGREGRGILVVFNATQPSDLIQDNSGTRSHMDFRTYGIGAQILADLGVHDMVLLSNTEQVLVALEAFDLSIVSTRSIPPSRRFERTLREKGLPFGDPIDDGRGLFATASSANSA